MREPLIDDPHLALRLGEGHTRPQSRADREEMRATRLSRQRVEDANRREDIHLPGVQEFKIPIFEVTAVPDESEDPTDRSNLRVSSRFFSGQPNSGAKLHWKAVWNRGDYEAGEGFRLDDTSSENVTADSDERDR